MDELDPKNRSFSYTARHDPRVTSGLTIISTILAGLIVTGVIALFNLNTQVAVLLARPVGVPREEYARDTARRDDDFNNFKLQIADMRTSVEKLHDQALERNLPPPQRNRQ